MRNSIKIFVVIAAIFGWGTQAHAWCGKYTHTSLTKKAISNNNQSVLDGYLKEQLEQNLGG